MKKKMNFLCVLVFVVLILSMSQTIYSVFLGATHGVKAGFAQGSEQYLSKENRDHQIKSLKPLHVIPINLLETQDSIYNEKTQSNVPIWYIQGIVSVDANTSMTTQMLNSLGSAVILIAAIYVVVQFFKLIRSINRYEIFCWRNVRRLRKIGFGLLMMFTIQFIISLSYNQSLSESLTLSNYIIDPTQVFSDSSLLLGVISLIFAEIFAIGLKMKEEQDLTI